MNQGYEFAARVAGGRMTDADGAQLQKAFAAWLNAGGAVSLERCCHMPATLNAIRLVRRDYWLVEAALLIDVPGVWLGPVALSNALGQFIARGAWREWCTLADPPAGTDDLRRALFYIAQANDGEGLSPRQVQRIAGEVFR